MHRSLLRSILWHVSLFRFVLTWDGETWHRAPVDARARGYAIDRIEIRARTSRVARLAELLRALFAPARFATHPEPRSGGGSGGHSRRPAIPFRRSRWSRTFP